MKPLFLPRTSETTDWLPRTKITPSTLNDNILVRHRVLTALHNAICDYRLTLLLAPPGYGKSTLLNLWLHAASGWEQTDNAMPAAYLSLNATENDLSHFLLALIAALQTLHPACGRRAQSFLCQKSCPELLDAAIQTQILTSLVVGDIAEYLPQRFVLILDNYEQISEMAAHNALDYLLWHLPPQAHIVVSTNQEPPFSLAKMQTQGLATIMNTEILAFDEVESCAFLDKVAELSLTDTEKIALHRHVEGWPAGLCLLAQEICTLPDATARTRLVASLDSGCELLSILPPMEDYLCEESYDYLPPLLQTFWLQSFILATLKTEAYNTVTGCQNTADLLQIIHRYNLFLSRQTIQQDDEDINHSCSQQSFRYHSMFAAFPCQRLH